MIRTADLVDRFEDSVSSCEVQFRSFGGRRAFAGQIVTIDCVEDNVLIKQTLGNPGHGKVLVVDGHGSLRCALVGDVIAGLGLANGWAGIVINGAVRDVVALRDMAIGVLALGSNPSKSAKRCQGSVGVPLRFGGVVFRPGDYLVADDDGILVSSVALPTGSDEVPA